MSELQLPLEMVSISKTKLKICIRNGAFLGEIPKTTLAGRSPRWPVRGMDQKGLFIWLGLRMWLDFGMDAILVFYFINVVLGLQGHGVRPFFKISHSPVIRCKGQFHVSPVAVK